MQDYVERVRSQLYLFLGDFKINLIVICQNYNGDHFRTVGCKVIYKLKNRLNCCSKEAKNRVVQQNRRAIIARML